MLAGCTPVPAAPADADPALQASAGDGDLFAHDPSDRPLDIGETVPDFALFDARGQPLQLSQMRGAVAVVSFFAADDLRGDGGLVSRLGRLQEVLVPPLADDTFLVAVLLDASPQATELLRARAAETSLTWVHAARGTTAAMATAFGVALWESADGALRHTFSTVVVDRRGRVADRFPGLDGWSATDLAAAVALAAGHH